MGRIRRPLPKFYTCGFARADCRWLRAQMARKDRNRIIITTLPGAGFWFDTYTWADTDLWVD